MATSEIGVEKKASHKLQTKDLIYAGAFGAIYLVLMLIIIMGSGIIPILYLAGPLTVGLVTGTVYELLVLKIRKPGAALILGVLFALIACSSYVWSAVLAIVYALLAEVVIYLGRYQSRRMYLASFVVFNLVMSAPYLMLLTARDRFLELTAQYQGQAHADTLAALTPSWIYLVTIALAILGGLGGAFIANRVIRKHFDKAGVI